MREIAQLGQAILRQKAQRVDQLDEQVQQLIDDLFATSEAANGAGIAAPQIFESLRVFILSIKPTPRYPNAPTLPPTAVINPEIQWQSDEIEKDWEGCLSIPGLRGQVPRPTAIRVRYTNRQGKAIQQALDGFAARVFLHEYDHLEGLTWLDHVDDNREIVTEQEYLRIIGSRS